MNSCVFTLNFTLFNLVLFLIHLGHKKERYAVMYLSNLSFLIHSYVGIIQIRFMGRSSKLPLSLAYKLPVCDYRSEYKNKRRKCQWIFEKKIEKYELCQNSDKSIFLRKKTNGKSVDSVGKILYIKKVSDY